MKVTFYVTPGQAQPVRHYIETLPKEEAAEIAAVLQYIFHHDIDPTVDCRHIRGKLWELRPNQHRIFYVVVNGPEMVLLHAYKKQSRKAPKAEIRVAMKRLKEVTGD